MLQLAWCEILTSECSLIVAWLSAMIAEMTMDCKCMTASRFTRHGVKQVLRDVSDYICPALQTMGITKIGEITTWLITVLTRCKLHYIKWQITHILYKGPGTRQRIPPVPQTCLIRVKISSRAENKYHLLFLCTVDRGRCHNSCIFGVIADDGVRLHSNIIYIIIKIMCYYCPLIMDNSKSLNRAIQRNRWKNHKL